jgi:hypothetical protein
MLVILTLLGNDKGVVLMGVISLSLYAPVPAWAKTIKPY